VQKINKNILRTNFHVSQLRFFETPSSLSPLLFPIPSCVLYSQYSLFTPNWYSHFHDLLSRSFFNISFFFVCLFVCLFLLFSLSLHYALVCVLWSFTGDKSDNCPSYGKDISITVHGVNITYGQSNWQSTCRAAHGFYVFGCAIMLMAMYLFFITIERRRSIIKVLFGPRLIINEILINWIFFVVWRNV
jgi:hypothetical protein